MEEIARKFEDLANKIPDYESDVCDAINCLERATFSGVDKGKVQLELAKTRIKEMDDLIAETLKLVPLSDEVNDRLMQCLVSFRPRLESHIEHLESLIENPPKESLFPPIDDSEIFPKEKQDTEDKETANNGDGNTNNQNTDNQDNNDKQTIQSTENRVESNDTNLEQKTDQLEKENEHQNN